MILNYLLLIVKFYTVKSELTYSEPTFPLQNPNFTLGGLFSITGLKSSVNKDGLEGALAMMCTLKEFNTGKGSFALNGIFNGLIYDAGESLPQAESAAMKLLQYNLHSTNDQVKTENATIQVGAIIAKLNTTIFFATQPIFAGFPFTFMGVQYINNGIFGSNFTSNSSNTVPELRTRIVPQSFVISAASSSIMAASIVEMLVYFNWTLCTVIYSRDAFGMEGQAFLQPALQAKNILTTCNIITSTSDSSSSEFQSLAECLNQNDSRIVIFWSGADTRIIVSTCNYIQSLTKYKLIFITPGSETDQEINSNALVPLSSSFLFKSVNYVPISTDNLECISTARPENQEFFDFKQFQEYWNEKFTCESSSNDEDVLQCQRQAFISTSIELSQVIYSTQIILKSISLMQHNCTLLTNLMGTYKLSRRDYCLKSEFTAADIYLITNLVLILGVPNFLASGTEAEGLASQSLQILQINQTGQVEPVGTYSAAQNITIFPNIQWPNDQVPISEVTIDNPTLNDAIVVVFFSFAVLAIIGSVVLAGTFFHYRQDKLLRRSSPAFNYLIILGMDLIFISLIFYGLTYTSATCFLYAWLLAIGVGLCLSSILVKNYRIYRIFKNSEATALILSDGKLFKFIGLIIFCEIVLLSLYCFVSGLLGPVVIQSSSDVFYKYRICLVPSPAIQVTFLLLIYLFNFLILISIALFAFLTRKIDDSYSEARGIAYAVYCTILFQIIFLPLLYTTQDSTASAMTRYTVTGIIILGNGYLLLIFLFGEKLYKLMRKKKASS